jgi:hypothetical protein
MNSNAKRSIYIFILCNFGCSWFSQKLFLNADDNVPINMNWQSESCVKSNIIDNDLFGLIRAAVAYEHHNVYFSLESSWMNRFYLTTTRVKVYCQDISRLESITFPPPMEPLSDLEETLYAMYVPTPISYSSTTYSSGPIDTFLTRNPCWQILVSILFICIDILNALMFLSLFSM